MALNRLRLVRLVALVNQFVFGRRNRQLLAPGGSRFTLASMDWKRKAASVLGGAFLAASLALGGRGGTVVKPSEVAFSEFLKVADKQPRSFHGGVRMAPHRWDFALAVPVDHPAPGYPIIRSPSAAQPAPLLGTQEPAVAAAATKAEKKKKLSARAARAAAAAELAAATTKAVPLFTRPVGFGGSSGGGGGDPASAVGLLRDREVPFGAAAPSKLAGPLRVAFPVAYLALVYAGFTKMTKGQTGSAGKGVTPGQLPPGSGFEGVAGLGPAKQEVSEIVAMLRNPAQYAAAGARLPAGVLLVGPPGTGKTLMARAVAAEAGVPFFSCSGSDFVEMFVGRGAARVRQLFAEAKKSGGPAVVFVDELDAVGRARSTLGGGPLGGGLGGSNAEQEQTLNQLLACMDGLDTSNDGVMVVAATNRFGLLDEALTRPGRFDRVVRVELPDEAGRREILAVHARRLNLGPERGATLALAAAVTPGASGAELATLANEAAIRCVRRGGGGVVTAQDFTDAAMTAAAGRSGAGAGGKVGQMLKETLMGAMGDAAAGKKPKGGK